MEGKKIKEHTAHYEPIPYMLVKDYFSQEDTEKMLKESKYLKPHFQFENGEKMKDGHKQNTSLFLDDFYGSDRESSDTLSIMDKIYNDSDLISKLYDMSWFYKVWPWTNFDNTFVSYYEDSDFYNEHTDIAVISMMYWLWEEPKSFTGGNLHLTDYDIEIPIERNQLMIMPSSTRHAVDPVKMIKQTDKLSGMGRYCIVRFLKLK